MISLDFIFYSFNLTIYKYRFFLEVPLSRWMDGGRAIGDIRENNLVTYRLLFMRKKAQKHQQLTQHILQLSSPFFKVVCHC